MGGVCNTPLHGRSTMAAVIRSPPKCFPIAADTCRALLFPARNMGGVCFCAPTRTSDNGRCRSFAPEMFSDCGGYPTGAIVLGPEHRGRMQYAPTRTSDNGCCHSFAPVGIHFIGHRVPSAGRVGAYCIRPIKWPRRGQIRRQQISVGRYCFLPGTWGAYAFAPLHERPTAAPDVHPPPECFPIRAPDAHSPLSETILWADDTHSPLKCFPMGAADAWAPLSECPIGAAGIWAPLSECPTGAAGAQTPSKWFPTGCLFAQTPPKWFSMGRLFAQTPSKWFPTGRLFAQTPHLCIFLTASGAWRPPMDRTRKARTDPRPAMGKRK